MKLLALDTSSDACSVAVECDGQIFKRLDSSRKHSSLILPMIEGLLAEAGLTISQLDAIAFGRGPGSFTGLRIGAGVVQGIAYGADLPVVAVSSLAVLAQGSSRERSLVVVDAHMNQVYCGYYWRSSSGLVEAVSEEQVINLDAIPLPEDHQWYGVGSGWDAYSEILQRRMQRCLSGWQSQCYPLAEEMLPLAGHAFRAGHTIPAEHVNPVYLRDNVARKMSER